MGDPRRVRPAPAQADHAYELGTGGDAQPRLRLRVLASLDTPPNERQHCPSRPCTLVRCDWHMQVDHTRPNQHSDGEPRYPKFVDASKSTCLLDLLETNRGGMTVRAIAAELGISERYTYRVLESAKRKLRAAARRKDLAP